MMILARCILAGVEQTQWFATYQQIVSPEIIDVLDYWICNDVVYSKTVSINADGDGAHC
jgi:hypothetical protein